MYQLMLFDKVLIDFEFQIKDNLFNKVKFVKIHENADKLISHKMVLTEESLYDFLESRSIPKNKTYVKQLISSLELEIANIENVLKITKGLSLNDSYWVKESNEKISFDTINLYENEFSESLSLVAFTGYSKKIKELRTSPEFSTDGMLAKCWKRIDGELYLYKGVTEGFANSGLEAYSEYYASQIAEVMKLDSIEYDIERYVGKLCSTCKIFTNKEVSYVPIGHVVKKGGLEAVIDYLKQHENTNMYDKFVDMILFDSLIMNKDRHYGNFGFLVDSYTNEIIEFAPIFDNGAGLLAYLMDDELTDPNKFKNSYESEQTSYYNIRYDNLVKSLAGKRHVEMLNKLNNFKFVRHEQYNLSEKRLTKLETIINERACLFKNLIREKLLDKTMSN